MATNQDLNIIIKTVLQNGDVWKSLNKELKEAKTKLLELQLQGKQNTSEYKAQLSLVAGLTKEKQKLNQSIKDNVGSTNKANSSLIAMSGTIGAVIATVTIAIGAIVKFTDVLLNVAKSGAEFNVLKKGFDDLSGNVEQSEESLKLFGKALAGNLDDKKIMQFANSFRLLGESDEEIAKFFDIAETRTELFGGSVETAIETLQRFIETGNRKGALGLKFDIDAIEKTMTQLGNTTVDNIKKMSQEDQQLLRKQAVYKLYGKTIDEINEKKKDEADAIQSLFTLYENIKTSIQSFISTALKPFISAINDVVEYIQNLKVEFGNLNKEFPELEKSIKFIGQVFERMGQDALNSVKTFIDANLRLIQAVAVATGTVIKGVVAGLIILGKGAKAIVDLTNKVGGVFGFTIDGSGIDGIISRLEGLSNEIAETSKVDSSTRASMEKGNNNFKIKSNSNSKNEKEDLTHLEELQKQLKEAQKVLQEIEADGGTGNQFWINQKKVVDDLTKSIERYTTDIRLVIPDDVLQRTIQSLDKQKILPGDLNKQIDQMKLGFGTVQGEEEKEKEKEEKSFEDKLNASLGVANEIISVLGLGADSFIGSLLNGLQSALSLATSIGNFLSTVLNIGSGGLGSVFGFIGSIFGLATGGTAHSNQPYIVGERGQELFVPETSGIVIPNWITEAIINGGGSLTGRSKFLANGGSALAGNSAPNVSLQIVGGGISRLDELKIYSNGKEIADRRGDRNLN